LLVSHHAALSTLAAALAAPVVKDRTSLALFWAAAVGQDVDHYLWHAITFRNLSLKDAYHFFRSRYGQRKGKQGIDMRALHGIAPLAGALAATIVDRRLAPILLGMAFHGFLDGLHEYVLAPKGVEAPGQWREQEPHLIVERAPANQEAI
jgi:hypothetical protein